MRSKGQYRISSFSKEEIKSLLEGAIFARDKAKVELSKDSWNYLIGSLKLKAGYGSHISQTQYDQAAMSFISLENKREADRKLREIF